MDNFLINNAVNSLKLITTDEKNLEDKELSNLIKKTIKIRDAISDLGNKVGSAQLVEQSAIGCFFGKDLVNFKLTEKQLKEAANFIAKKLEQSGKELADWTGEFINDKDKKEKYFLFKKKSRGIIEEYFIKKQHLNSPEAEFLGQKETKDILTKFFHNGKNILISGENKFPVGSKISGKIKNITDFGLFVSLKDYDLEGLVHYKDLSYSEMESDLKNYSKNQDLKLKILEIDSQKEKIRLGLKQLMLDPLEYFRGKSKKDIITVTVKEISENAIKVSPDGCDLKFLIRKGQIAVDKQDQRVTRFTKGDRLDVMIQECDIEKRKISLSIKMLEEEENKTAIKKYGSVDSGKSLPFADLPSALKKKKTNKEK